MELKKRKRLKPEDQFYVNNKRMFEIIVEYRNSHTKAVNFLVEKGLANTSEEAEKMYEHLPQVPDELAIKFLKIAQRYGNSPKFSQYPYLDEMISDGVLHCIKYAHKFNPEVSKNPFAYFTTTVTRAFLQRIRKEKKLLYVKYKEIDAFIAEHGDEYFLDQYGSDFADANMRDYIDIYEKSLEEKKKAKRKKPPSLFELGEK